MGWRSPSSPSSSTRPSAAPPTRSAQRALDLEAAGDAEFARGRVWGGNEAAGWARGQHEPVGLVHLAHGDEHRMR